MENDIENLLSYLRKERILMYKIVESEEKQDNAFFYHGVNLYKEIATCTDNLLKKVISDNSYKNIVEFIVENYSKNDEIEYDALTLLGLVNTLALNKISNEFYCENSDPFSNTVIANLYNMYLWSIKKNNYEKEVVEEMRYDIVNTLVNSMAMREYFKGNYSVFDEIEFSEKKDKIEKKFYNALNTKINVSNSIEMFEGISNDVEFNARCEVMKLEFASLASLMEKENIKFPLVFSNISDFTEEIICDASSMLEKYNNNESKKEKVIKL